MLLAAKYFQVDYRYKMGYKIKKFHNMNYDWGLFGTLDEFIMFNGLLRLKDKLCESRV